MALTRPLGRGVPLKQCCGAVSSGINIIPEKGREVHQVTRAQLSELHLSPASELHVHSSSRYPPLVPPNIDELNSSRFKFSPRRSRDISGRLALLGAAGLHSGALTDQQAVSGALDTHVNSYDCRGTVSLHSVMQTTVPEPFDVQLAGHSARHLLMPGGRPTHLNMPGGRPTHLNMPGGQCRQEDKFLSRDLQHVHPSRLPRR